MFITNSIITQLWTMYLETQSQLIGTNNKAKYRLEERLSAILNQIEVFSS